jgi:AcrR family transcriptional regulator
MKETVRSTRQQILETAAELFFREGCRAIGVDTIVNRSGVAKMTLYRHFPSKDDLLIAYLKEANDHFWAWFEAAINQHPDSPRDQLIAVFEALAQGLTSPMCYGCPFINAGTEFSEMDHPVHKAALEHKQAVRVRLRAMSEAAGARSPDALSDQLLLLMDGGYVQARLFGTQSPAAHVAEAAEALIAAQLSD